jgi:hypothetical protein
MPPELFLLDVAFVVTFSVFGQTRALKSGRLGCRSFIFSQSSTRGDSGVSLDLASQSSEDRTPVRVSCRKNDATLLAAAVPIFKSFSSELALDCVGL